MEASRAVKGRRRREGRVEVPEIEMRLWDFFGKASPFGNYSRARS